MIIVALALVAVAVAVPVELEPAKIVESTFKQTPEGSYNFGYECEDGAIRQEEGQLKEVLDEAKKPYTVVVVRGEYSYPSKDAPNGKEAINYYADEFAYQAEGLSVPKAERR